MTDEEQAVAEDRKELIKRITEFDPSDDYHQEDDIYPSSYYAAIDRVVLLLRGDIQSWASPKPQPELPPVLRRS